MKKNSTLMRLCMALLLAVLTTAVRADVVPFTESYNAESTTDGWTSSVAGDNPRFTPIIYNEADLQQGTSDNYFLSVNQSERSNNGCIVTGTVLSGKAAAGDDFTLEFDMRLCNSNNNVNSQFPVSLQIKDADNDKDILSLSTPAKYVQTWIVNGTDLQVTLPQYGGYYISELTWCHYIISRSGSLTYLTITNNSTQEAILERTLIGGSSETGGLGNIVFTTKRYRSNFAIDNIVVRALKEGDVPAVEMSSYTIKYRSEGGEEIAADIVTPYIVGNEASASDGQMVPIYYNGKKYLYKEGNSTITLVSDAAQNVITLVYREAQKCSYTIMGKYGDKEKVLHEGTGYEGDIVTYNYPEYILDGTTLYLKQTKTTNPHFGGTILLNEANITEYVYYTDGEASNVVYYKEAEQMDGFTPLATNNADIRCSDGKGGVIDGDEPVVLTTLPAGTYTIHGQIWGTAGYTATITAGDKTVWELTSVGWIIDSTSDIFTLDEETTLYIKDSGDLEGKKMLDLIYIQEAKPQYVAEFNRVEGTLTFKKGTLSLGAATTWDAENTGSEPGWYSQRTNVKTVIFDESFADARPTSCAQWFKGATTLTTITGLEYLNTSEVTSMNSMFSSCRSLTSLDVNNFNTSNVTDMNTMFEGCWSLTLLDLSNFNTSKVTNMGNMFSNCSSLTSLDLSNFNTSKVTNMGNMFSWCSSLTSLDLGNFNTSNLTAMYGMFNSCRSLASLDVSNFNTSNVTDMVQMFYGCSSFASLDVSNFNTSKVTDMQAMFSDCSSLKTINVGEDWNTSAVTNSDYMFSNCTALIGGAGTTYDAEHADAEYARIDGGTDAPGYFTDKNATPYVNPEAYAVLSEDSQTVTFYYDTNKSNRTGVMEINRSYRDSDTYGTATNAVIDASFVDYRPTSTAYWFSGCNNLTSITGMENLNTSNVTDMSYMFYRCNSLTSLDVSNFNTSNVTNMSCLFLHCNSLSSLDVSNFNTSNVTDMDYMFGGCWKLTSLDVSNFNTSNVTNMNFMFGECQSLTSLDVSNFNTSNVTNMAVMFYHCTSLTSLDVSNFNTSNVTSMGSMFQWCTNLTSLDLSNFNTSKVTEMFLMFQACSSLKYIYVGDGWTTDATTSSYDMFAGCTALIGGAGTAFDANHIDAEYARIDGGTDAPGYFTDKNATPFVKPEAYAVLSEDGQTVTFYYDTQKANRTGVMEINQSYNGGVNAYGTATTAVIDASFADYRPTSTAYWFYRCSNLTSLDVSNLNTSNVTDMSMMFYGCSSLKTILVGDGWTTDAVTESYSMFYNCTALIGCEGTLYHEDHIDAEYARIDGVSYLPGYLTDKRVSSTDNPKAYAVLSDDGQTVTFYYDTQKANRTGVVEINRNYIMPENDVHSAYGTATSAVFDASFANYHPISTAFWFQECSKLISVTGMEHLNTEYVVDMQAMFLDCKSLKSLDLSHFNTSKVQYLSAMFSVCEELTSIDLSSFNTPKLRAMNHMFNNCYQLTELDLSKFNTENVYTMQSMLYNCSKLKSVNLANFKTLQVKWMENMFVNCSSLTELDLSSFETPNLTYVVGMFQKCSSLKTIYVGEGWSSERVTHSGWMFSNCEKLVGGAGTVYDANHTDIEYARIDGSADAPGYFTAKNVTPKDNVTLAAKSYSRQYGEANPAFEYDVTEGTITSGTPELSSEATATSPVGTYDIVISKGSVTNNEVSLVNGTLTITKAPLTISCGSYTIEQGEVLPDFALEYNGWKNDETEDVLTTKPTVTCEASKDSEPGTYDIIVSGAEAQNYEISYVAGKLTVTARKDNVTLTAKSYTREYGEANPVFEYDVTEGTITDGTPELSSEATATSPVGTYDIVISKGNVTNNEVSLVNGTLTITKAPLTISCGDYTIMQGEALPYFAPMYDGWKNGETEKVLTQRPTVWCVARQDSEPGTYDIIVSGAEAQNYEISYVAGTLTIEAKPIVIEPVEVETEMKTEALNGQDLSNNVVNDVYYNVGSDSYDASDKSIVISQTTNMSQIADKQPGSADVKENFNGMILKVAKGKGLITVNVKTSGNAQLVVQVGNGTPMLASKTEKGDVVFRYDVEEDTYVYIYAIIGSSAAKGYGINAADTESSVRIYGITVSPGATGIRSIGASEKNDGNIYDLQGHRVETPAKGIYIIGGRKVAVK